ncbi:hypothetical protein [uncultured Cohaesibacter sp.]|uniref:hypothetical protein n=1 Tax=uncultured Cohaesibacter sp. TaxID=1002546 RepID=UPI0029C82DB6|nr:hypothetical protein [uncultured Cohaesibacter sp.]
MLFHVKQQQLASVDLAGYRGDEWFQVTDAEEQVFGLGPDDMPAMAVLWDWFELMLGLVEPYEGCGLTEDLIRDVRKELDWLEELLREPVPTVSSELFTKFASYFGVTNRKAHAFYCKYEFWQVRRGIISFSDE